MPSNMLYIAPEVRRPLLFAFIDEVKPVAVMSRSLLGLNSSDSRPPLRSRTPSTNSDDMLPGMRTPFRSAAVRPVPASEVSVMPFIVVVLMTSQPLLVPYAKRDAESRRL
ncbi:MAG TPA: hypothetical protein VFS02_07530 [Telluria sp.]|nr:hypothetical protein [Telluria sp.]